MDKPLTMIPGGLWYDGLNIGCSVHVFLIQAALGEISSEKIHRGQRAH